MMYVNYTEKRQATVEVERSVIQLLLDIGVRTNTQGYYLTRDAVLMVYEDPSLLRSIYKNLYGGLAEKADSTPSRVERNIRHCIVLTWRDGDKAEIAKIFGYATYRKGPPSVSYWITRLAEEIRLRERRK